MDEKYLVYGFVSRKLSQKEIGDALLALSNVGINVFDITPVFAISSEGSAAMKKTKKKGKGRKC